MLRSGGRCLQKQSDPSARQSGIKFYLLLPLPPILQREADETVGILSFYQPSETNRTENFFLCRPSLTNAASGASLHHLGQNKIETNGVEYFNKIREAPDAGLLMRTALPQRYELIAIRNYAVVPRRVLISSGAELSGEQMSAQ
jgi:hypothetical protein